MGKGIAALAYLPQIDLVLPTGNAVASIEAFRGLANVIAKMQADGVADGTYTGVLARGNNPYDSSIWTIVKATGTTFTCTFVSEVSTSTSADGRAGLSTRRPIDILKVTTANDCTVRSFLALLNFIEGIEDRVAETNSGAAGDATYTAVALRGHTPFKTYTWTVTKLAALYTLTTTATSN
jgi:hypothetical protein